MCIKEREERGGGKNRYMGKARPATMASRACSLETDVGRGKGGGRRCEKCTAGPLCSARGGVSEGR